MEYPVDEIFVKTENDVKLDESSYHNVDWGIEMERNYYVDIKGNFDVNVIKCENATVKREIENVNEYNVKIENEGCTDRKEEFEARLIKFEEILIEPKIEDLVEDNM